jgi:hypothetical protein
MSAIFDYLLKNPKVSQFTVSTIEHDIESDVKLIDDNFIMKTTVVNEKCKPKILDRKMAHRIMLKIKNYIDNACRSKKGVTAIEIEINTVDKIVKTIYMKGFNEDCDMDEIKDKVMYGINEMLEKLMFSLCNPIKETPIIRLSPQEQDQFFRKMFLRV